MEKKEIKTFEIFTENYSTIIQEDSIEGAIVQFKFVHPLDNIIGINDVAYNDKSLFQSPPKVSDKMEAIKLLRDLADLQNDAPLESHRKQWEETMEKVYAFLNESESLPSE